MRTTIAPVSAAERRAAAAAFGAWLRDHPLERQALRDRRLTLGQLIERSGIAISSSSAYRLALRLGLVGRRRNRSRYDRFWSLLDWRLPDAVLAEIWEVDRGNLRRRRGRLGVGPPAWTSYAVSSPMRRAIAAQGRRARCYEGLRPCCGISPDAIWSVV